MDRFGYEYKYRYSWIQVLIATWASRTQTTSITNFFCRISCKASFYTSHRCCRNHLATPWVQIFLRIICWHMLHFHKISWIYETKCVLLISFLQKIIKIHIVIQKYIGNKYLGRYSDIQVSSILYLYLIFEPNIYIRIRICYLIKRLNIQKKYILHLNLCSSSSNPDSDG